MGGEVGRMAVGWGWGVRWGGWQWGGCGGEVGRMAVVWGCGGVGVWRCGGVQNILHVHISLAGKLSIHIFIGKKKTHKLQLPTFLVGTGHM